MIIDQFTNTFFGATNRGLWNVRQDVDWKIREPTAIENPRLCIRETSHNSVIHLSLSFAGFLSE